MSPPTFLNPFAPGAQKTGGHSSAEHYGLSEAADLGQPHGDRGAMRSAREACRTPYPERLDDDDLVMALLTRPVPRRTRIQPGFGLSSQAPGSSWQEVDPSIREVDELPECARHHEAPDYARQSTETRRSRPRKGSLIPAQGARYILLPLVRKLVDLFKPKEVELTPEERRNLLKDLLSLNPLPNSSVDKRNTYTPPRPPRPPSISGEVLDLMGLYASPAALSPIVNTARRVFVAPPAQTLHSMRPEVQLHSSPTPEALQFPPRPPPKTGRVGGSLPTIPHVRQKIGVAPDPRGRPRRRQPVVAVDRGEVYWDVLQVNRICVSRSGGKWLSGGMLGQGGFGTVYLVYNVARREQCAMKVVHYSRGMSETSCRGVVNELKVLRRLAEERRPAPYLLQPYTGDELWAWRSPGGYLHVVTELCTGGDLSCYQYRLSDETLALVCAEVVVGLHYLHQMGIVHHDLKPQNVLVSAEGHCVIGDYGGAQFLDHQGRIERGPRGMAVMTIPYAAPELLLEGDTTYGPEVDYWALGATLVSLIMDDDFLPGAQDSSALWVRLRRIETKMRQLGVSEKLHGFVMALLDESPSTRPSYATIGELPFLLDVDWDAVQKQRCPPFRLVREIGALAHGFSIPTARVHETRAPVDLLQRMRQEQLSLVVDASYDVEAHKTLITAAV